MTRRAAFLTMLAAILAPALAAAAWSPSPGAPGPTPDKGSLSGLESLSPAAPQADCPQSGGVILYYGWDYGCEGLAGDPGYRLRATPGFENISGAFDDEASSLRVPAGWSVKLYDGADRGGASICRTVDDPRFNAEQFDDGVVNLNDHVSSFDVFDNPTCGSNATGAVLWQDWSYGGLAFGISGEGFENLTDHGWNDEMSSIQVAPGWSARLYNDIDRGGSSRCFNRNDIDFENDTFDDGTSLNDRVSSIDVYHLPDCPYRSCTSVRSLQCASSDAYGTDQPGATDQVDYYSCATYLESGPEVIYSFTPGTLSRVHVTLMSGVDLDLFVLDGASGSCGAGACVARSATSNTTEQTSFFARAGQTYYIAADGYNGAAGSYTIQVTCQDAHAAYLPLGNKR